MRKLNLILIIAIVFSLGLLGSQIYAQQGGGGQQGGQQGGGQQFQQRQQFTPEQMAERRMTMIKDRLKLSDADFTAIKPNIEAFTKIRTAQGEELRPKIDALQKAADAKDAKLMASALKAYKDKRTEQKAAYEKAETDFLKFLADLPVEIEANLTLMGIVSSDGGMGFGGFRPGGPGQDQGGQRQGGQRQGNQQGQGN